MPEALRVYCWRHEELMRAGYPLIAATKIACREDVDLHQAVALLVRGCSVDEAMRNTALGLVDAAVLVDRHEALLLASEDHHQHPDD